MILITIIIIIIIIIITKIIIVIIIIIHKHSFPHYRYNFNNVCWTFIIYLIFRFIIFFPLSIFFLPSAKNPYL